MTRELVYLADKINEELKIFESDIALGKAKDFGDYKFGCGVYTGLLKAKGMLVEIAEKMQKEDNA